MYHSFISEEHATLKCTLKCYENLARTQVLRRIKDTKEKKFQELRYIFIHLFSQTDVIRRKDVKEACEKCFGDAKHLTASRYSKLTQEFATSVGSRWHLKTGNEDNMEISVVDLTT